MLAAAVSRSAAPRRLLHRQHRPRALSPPPRPPRGTPAGFPKTTRQHSPKSPLQNGWSNEAKTEPRVAWSFGGEFNLPVGLGKDLYHQIPSFHQLWDQLEDQLSKHALPSLKSILWNETPSAREERIHLGLCGWQLIYGWFLKSLDVPCDAIHADRTGELAAAVHAGIVECDTVLDLLAKKTTGEAFACGEPICDYISTHRGPLSGENPFSLDTVWNSITEAPPPKLDAIPVDPQTAAVVEFSPGIKFVEEARTNNHPIIRLNLPGQAGEEYRSLLTVLARLYVQGVNLQWRLLYPPDLEIVSLPGYPFERKPYWISRQILETPSNNINIGWLHPLLHRQYDLAGNDQVFETDLSKVEFLKDHKVQDAAVFPLAGYLEMAAAAARILDDSLWTVDDLQITSPIKITPGEACLVQLVLRPDGEGWSATMSRKTPQGWQPRATCQIRRNGNQLEFNGAVNWPEALNQQSAAAISEHYQRCRRVGLDYGPAFQILQRLHAEQDQAWAVIAAKQENPSEKFGIHPARLDGCFQAIASALPAEITTALVPTDIQRFSLYCRPDGAKELYCHVHHLREEGRGYRVDLDIFDEHKNRVAQVEQLKLQPLEPSTLGYYIAEWPAKLRQKDFPPAYIAPPAELCTHLRSKYEEAYNVSQVEAHSAMLDQLEQSTSGCAWDVLSQLGLELTPGHTFLLEDAVQDCRVVETQRALFARLLNMLVEDGYLQSQKGVFSVEKPIARSWMPAVPEASQVEIALFQRCLEHLPDVLRGTCDPLTILFPPDEDISASLLYTQSVGAKALNYLAAEVVAQIQSRLPEGRGLRFLEIGAGTGATTEALLNRTYSQRLDYVFTDISSHFFAAAKQQFSQYPISTYKTLDIERSPEEQGFERESFDIIIAANVLHATCDLRRSLRHVRELLKPEGALLLVEGTRRVRWLDFVFGMTPGWWAFRDYDLRPDYPLITPKRWNEVLNQAGFGLVETYNPHRQSCKLEPANSLIVAQADAVPQPYNDSQSWLVIGNDFQAQRLQETLIARNQQSRLISWCPDGGDAEVYESIITSQDLTKPRLNILIFWPHTSADAANIPEMAFQGCESILGLIQTLIQQSSKHRLLLG